jgi:hypothetical protein
LNDESSNFEDEQTQGNGSVTVEDVAATMRQAAVEEAAKAIAYCRRPYAIKALVSEMMYGLDENGEIRKYASRHMMKVILKDARLLLRTRASIGLEEARAESIGFYENITANDDTAAQSRIRARENLDKILGVAAPDVHVSLNGSISSTPKLSDLGLDLEQRKAALASIRKAKTGEQQA